MAQLYIWKASAISEQDAYARFTHVLSQQCALYTTAFGRDFTYKLRQLDAILIGQIQFDLGVQGWASWHEQQGVGVAWSGVCEQYLGHTHTPVVIQQVHRAVNNSLADIAAWDGRFGLCTWQAQAQRVTLTTAGTDSPTFWQSEGPQGWAVGNRALPILELVGRRPCLDHVAASIFITYGYLAGDTALCSDVVRLPERRHVVIEAHTPPKISTYSSLQDYLGLDQGRLSRETAIKQAAERVVTRVTHQLKHSVEPEILLTGGRDSRWILAAASKTGIPFKARTSGAKGSKDVQVAGAVAHALGATHEHELHGGQHASVKSLIAVPEKVLLWTRISEGAETIRHSLPFQAFYDDARPFPALKRQVFHGLHAFGGLPTLNSRANNSYLALDKKADAQALRAMLSPHISEGLVLRTEVQEAIDRKCMQLLAETRTFELSHGQWINLFYWQNRCSHWAEDMMSVKDLIDWHWTPLFDQQLIRLFWDISSYDRFSKEFIQDATFQLAPALRQIEYDKRLPSKSPLVQITKQLAKQVKRYSRAVFPATKQQAQPQAHQQLIAFWKQVLFASNNQHWHELIDKATVRTLMETNPAAETLWNIATVELFAQAYL